MKIAAHFEVVLTELKQNKLFIILYYSGSNVLIFYSSIIFTLFKKKVIIRHLKNSLMLTGLLLAHPLLM